MPVLFRLCVAAAILSVFSTGLAGSEASADQNDAEERRLIERAKIDYVEGRYVAALKLFSEIKSSNSDDVVALHGYARANHALHLYDEAIAAYEKAMAIAPNDSLIRRDYVAALAWGGVFQGDRRLIEKAIVQAGESAARWPDVESFYDSLRTACDYLGGQDLYVRHLEELHRSEIRSEILEFRVMEARLTVEMRRENQEGIEKQKTVMRLEADRLESRFPDPAARPAATTYKLAGCYYRSGEKEKARALIERLHLTPGGEDLVRSGFPVYMVLEEIYGSSEPAEKLRIIAGVRNRIKRSWERRNELLNTLDRIEFDSLVELARRSRGDGETAIDGIVRLGRHVAQSDTSGGLAGYERAARLLNELGLRPAQALELAMEGIDGLEEGRPGLLYPGNTEQEREEARLAGLARLKLLKAESLERLGRNDEAHAAIRESIESRPTVRGYDALGKSLLNRGEPREAYDAFLGALALAAIGAAAPDERMRQRAIEAGGVVGKTVEQIEVDVKERVAFEGRRLLGRRVNQPAPDFEIKDVAGREWRLRELRGKVVVLNFWATWCGPCIAEFPHYNQLVREYAENKEVVFLAISIDSDRAVVAPWLKGKGYEFAVLYDDGTSLEYRVTGIPATVFVDREGRIQFRTTGFPGPEAYMKKMRDRITALLDE